MVMGQQVSLRWNMPPSWYSFSASRLADPEWRENLPPAEPGSSYDEGLTRFAAWVAEQTTARAGWVVVLTPDHLPPAVVAMGSLDVRPGPGIEELASEIARATAPPEIVSRTVERVVIADDPALVCHDLVAVGHGPEGVGLRERGLAVRHVAAFGLDLAVDITTDDLAGFEQIAASAAEALAGVHISQENAS